MVVSIDVDRNVDKTTLILKKIGKIVVEFYWKLYQYVCTGTMLKNLD